MLFFFLPLITPFRFAAAILSPLACFTPFTPLFHQLLVLPSFHIAIFASRRIL